MDKILIDVVYMTGKHGGFENILNIACSYLCRHGFRVRYVQMLSSGTDWSGQGIEFHCLNLPRDPFSYEDARSAYAAFLSAGAEFPSLILAAGWPNMVYIAKGAVSDLQRPVPVCAWLHGDIDFYREADCGDMRVLQHADMCFTINDKMARDVFQAYPDKVIYRVNNTTELSNICYSENRDTRKLAYVGRLSQEKALPMLLYALERTKEPWELSFVGEGEEKVELERLAKKLGIKNRIRFPGWHDNPWTSLTDCRALVLSSLYEGGPLVAIEALSCGMQTVSTPVGFLPELIREGTNGCFWEFGKPEQLTAILDRMAKVPYTPEEARMCRDSVSDFLPDKTLFDFLCKVYACARCKALPQRYNDTNRNLYLSPEKPFKNGTEERAFLDWICTQEYFDSMSAHG